MSCRRSRSGGQRLDVYSENAVVGLAEAIHTGIASTAVSESSAGLAADAHPIITGCKLILRDQDNVYAYENQIPLTKIPDPGSERV